MTDEQKKELPALGIHLDIPFHDYLRGPGISKHGLDQIQEAPARYWFEKQHPPPATPAMILGSALHTLVLEPDKFDSEYCKDMYGGSRSKEALAWRAAQQEVGRTCINDKTDTEKGVYGVSDWDRLHLMRDSVLANPIAAALLDGEGHNEMSMYWVDPQYKRLCRARADRYNADHNLMIDLKSAADASYSGFQRAVNDYRYDVQDAFYQDGGRLCGLHVEGMVFIAVEKKPPYLTACYMITPEWRAIGRQKYMRNLDTYNECLESGEWPGYPENRDLDMPRYARTAKIS